MVVGSSLMRQAVDVEPEAGGSEIRLADADADADVGAGAKGDENV